MMWVPQWSTGNIFFYSLIISLSVSQTRRGARVLFISDLSLYCLTESSPLTQQIIFYDKQKQKQTTQLSGLLSSIVFRFLDIFRTQLENINCNNVKRNGITSIKFYLPHLSINLILLQSFKLCVNCQFGKLWRTYWDSLTL